MLKLMPRLSLVEGMVGLVEMYKIEKRSVDTMNKII
uniref:Uncharacterized protein n=1 Tax=Rhizophora mucronata TaxID=61149 RepID=A0A2P2PXN3_RHIMU